MFSQYKFISLHYLNGTTRILIIFINVHYFVANIFTNKCLHMNPNRKELHEYVRIVCMSFLTTSKSCLVMSKLKLSFKCNITLTVSSEERTT